MCVRARVRASACVRSCVVRACVRACVRARVRVCVLGECPCERRVQCLICTLETLSVGETVASCNKINYFGYFTSVYGKFETFVVPKRDMISNAYI